MAQLVMIHILPTNDIGEHKETAECTCNPIVEWRNEETGQPYVEGVVIHHSFDQREAIEEAEKLAGMEPTTRLDKGWEVKGVHDADITS